MAFDTYMQFMKLDGKLHRRRIAGRSRHQLTDKSARLRHRATATIFEIDDYSFDIEQVLNIGSSELGRRRRQDHVQPVLRSPARSTGLADAVHDVLRRRSIQAGQPVLRRAGGSAGARRRMTQRHHLPALRLQAGRGEDDLLERHDGDEALQGNSDVRIWRVAGALPAAGREDGTATGRRHPRRRGTASTTTTSSTSRPASRRPDNAVRERTTQRGRGMRRTRHAASGRSRRRAGALKQEVRKSPRDVRLRTFLFQLFCVFGEWDRALTQLAAAGELDPLALPDGAGLPRGHPLRNAARQGVRAATARRPSSASRNRGCRC